MILKGHGKETKEKQYDKKKQKGKQKSFYGKVMTEETIARA